MKKLLVLVCVISILLLGGCGILTRYSFRDADKVAEERLKTLLRAVENQNRDEIIGMFSPQAIRETENMDAGIDYLFDILSDIDETVTWKNVAGSQQVSKEQVLVHEEYRKIFLVSIGERELSVTIKEYLTTEEAQLVGVYSIKVYDTSDEQPLYTDPGIYYPGMENP